MLLSLAPLFLQSAVAADGSPSDIGVTAPTDSCQSDCNELKMLTHLKFESPEYCNVGTDDDYLTPIWCANVLAWGSGHAIEAGPPPARSEDVVFALPGLLSSNDTGDTRYLPPSLWTLYLGSNVWDRCTLDLSEVGLTADTFPSFGHRSVNVQEGDHFVIYLFGGAPLPAIAAVSGFDEMLNGTNALYAIDVTSCKVREVAAALPAIARPR